jgi:Nucleotide modification associated domain 2
MLCSTDQSCGRSADSTLGDYPVPSAGPIASDYGLGLRQLRQRLKAFEHEAVYFYVIDTIVTAKSGFVQTGSGPNLLGDVVTLCTCKHWMRTFRSTTDWKDAWIAGFCDVAANRGQHALVYLMRVADAYESHRELWKHLSPHSKTLKNARVNTLGDVYEPNGNIGDAFALSSYHAPLRGHSHHQTACDLGWHGDIDYFGKKRRAALLVGSPSHTFVWNRPGVRYADQKHPLGRGQKRLPLGEFLGRLNA